MSTAGPLAAAPAGHARARLGFQGAAPVAGLQSEGARAALREIDGRTVSWFALGGGPRAGAIGPAEGEVVERAVELAVDLGVPLVGSLSTGGADVREGVASLHAWGRVARRLCEASGTVPVLLAVTGPCVSGPALLLGLADHVVMTPEAFAYVSGPDVVEQLTAVGVSHRGLGGAVVHALRTGAASLTVASADDVEPAVADLLWYLPSNSLDDPPLGPADDPAQRRCERAATAVPERATSSYDVRAVVEDVLDRESFLEVRAGWATNMVTGYGRLAGQAVGVVANQPCQRAGTVDIAASQKAARFVQHCDAFNLPLVTFVDTPGFEPGRDLEWRGMIRHGAQLVHAYAEATVPRLCVLLRKAYGGAYIVMDSRRLGNDYCVAWPGAQVAVMGASGAVQILHGRRLAGMSDPEARAVEQARLEDEFETAFLNPWRAAERGYVDAVVEPAETRAVLTAALGRIRTKREGGPRRRHSNIPL